MFGRADSRKKNKTHVAPKPKPEVAAESATASPPASGAFNDLKAGATEALGEGLTIEAYARQVKVSEAEVWRRLRTGDLVGRTEGGRLVIYSSPTAATVSRAGAEAGGQKFGPDPGEPKDQDLLEFMDDTLPEAAAAAAAVEDFATEDLSTTYGQPLPHSASDPDFSLLPPLPPSSNNRAGAESQGYLALSGEKSSSPELALLLDHLSLAKEENREILRMTQESIRKVTQLSEALVEMKDTVIEAKQSEIDVLKAQLQARDQEVKRLQQQNEDLEMLARTMADEKT